MDEEDREESGGEIEEMTKVVHDNCHCEHVGHLMAQMAEFDDSIDRWNQGSGNAHTTDVAQDSGDITSRIESRMRQIEERFGPWR